MWLSTFNLACRNLLLHKLRSLLTVLGTILGVASVIAMLSIGEGSKQAALEQIRLLGASNVIVRSSKPDSTTESDSGVLNYGLTYRDLLRIRETIPTIETVAPIRMIQESIRNGGNEISNGRILGVTPNFINVKNVAVRRGRFIDEIDEEKFSNVVVLSDGAARKLFLFRDPMGEDIQIGGEAYRVIGTLGRQDSGNARPGDINPSSLDDDIYIPLATARSRVGQTQRIVSAGSRSYERIELSEITLALDDQSKVESTAQIVREMLMTSHANQSDWKVVVPLELLNQAEREKRTWNIVLGSIAGISLLVGGIGIMNIMLATVTERTREIGIRRAIGARRIHIVVQFLVETVVLSTVGGLVGVVLGISIPLIVTLSAGIPTATSLWSILLAFGTSMLTGVIFGVYPARKAAMMSPIEALRHQ
jgi:putative ABC transport system permease protein